MMTRNELRLRMGWTFAQKLDHTLGVIEQFYNQTQGNVYIAFSGGKDSTVLLHIVRKLFDRNAKAVFCNTGLEYPAIIQFVKSWDNVTVIHPELTIRKVIDRYGFPLISKLQAKYIREARHTKSDMVREKLLHGQGSGLFPGVISQKWQFLVDAEFEVSDKCCDVLKKSLFMYLKNHLVCIPCWECWRVSLN
jgi:hypothetical protein